MAVTIHDLLASKVHFGHQVRRRNPKMNPFIFTARHGIHIIDILQTRQRLQIACDFLINASRENKKVLFVGTKIQAAKGVEIAARETNSFYINERWLGGMLTNWSTMSICIQKFNELDQIIKDQENHRRLLHEDPNASGRGQPSTSDEESGTSAPIQLKSPPSELLSKKEFARQKKKRDKLAKYFEGVKNMESLPDIVVLIGQPGELHAVKECRKLGIPTITLLDTNCDPDLTDFPIPGNDDSISSISLILSELTQAIQQGDCLR